MKRKMKREYSWEEIRDLILFRDGRCCWCGSQEVLQVDHIFSRRYKKLFLEPLNLITLCRYCHIFRKKRESGGYALLLFTKLGKKNLLKLVRKFIKFYPNKQKEYIFLNRS